MDSLIHSPFVLEAYKSTLKSINSENIRNIKSEYAKIGVIAVLEDLLRLGKIDSKEKDELETYTLGLVSTFDTLGKEISRKKVDIASYEDMKNYFYTYEIDQRCEKMNIVWKDTHPDSVLVHTLKFNNGKLSQISFSETPFLSDKVTIKFQICYLGSPVEMSFKSCSKIDKEFCNLFLDSDYFTFLHSLYKSKESTVLRKMGVKVEDFIFDEDFVTDLYKKFLEIPKTNKKYREKWFPKGQVPAERVMKFLGLKWTGEKAEYSEAIKSFLEKLKNWHKKDRVKLEEFINETENEYKKLE